MKSNPPPPQHAFGHVIACLHGQLDRDPMDRLDLISIAGRLQHLPRRSKRVCKDHLRSSANIVLVRFTYDIRIVSTAAPLHATLSIGTPRL